MASPQLENGYTKISNELLEALALVQMSGSEWQYVMCLIRKTYGYNQKEAWVNNTYVGLATGMPRQRVSEAKLRLLAKNVVTEKRDKISLNKDYESWGLSRKNGQTVTEKRDKLSRKSVHNKEKRKYIKHTEQSSEELSTTNGKDMGWNNKGDDYEEYEVQLDPDYQPKGKTKKQSVRAEVLAVFNLFENPAKAVWPMRPLERSAAEALLEAHGIEVLERRMKRIKKEQEKADPFFPNVYSPSQLLENMPKIERYIKT